MREVWDNEQVAFCGEESAGPREWRLILLLPRLVVIAKNPLALVLEKNARVEALRS